MSCPQGDAEEAEAGRGAGLGDAGAKDVDGSLAGSGCAPEEEAAGEDAQGLFAVVNRCPAGGQAPEEGVGGGYLWGPGAPGWKNGSEGCPRAAGWSG
jgi:hypothetical protein